MRLGILLAAALVVPACSDGDDGGAIGLGSAGALAGAPTGLTATSGDTVVILSWEAVQGAGGYNIKSATVQGGPYGLVEAVFSGTSFVDDTLQNGVTYFYRVSAVNGPGEGPDSLEVSATPQAGAVAPVSEPAPTTSPKKHRRHHDRDEDGDEDHEDDDDD